MFEGNLLKGCRTLFWYCCILFLLTLGGKSNEEVIEFILIGGHMNCPEGTPGPVYELMESCWNWKPGLSSCLI